MNKLWIWLTKQDPAYAGRRLIDPSYEGRVNRAFQARVLQAQDAHRTLLEGLMQPLVAMEDKP